MEDADEVKVQSNFDLLGEDREATAWASSENEMLENLLDGGVEHFEALEARLLEAQDLEERVRRGARGVADGDDADGAATRAANADVGVEDEVEKNDENAAAAASASERDAPWTQLQGKSDVRKKLLESEALPPAANHSAAGVAESSEADGVDRSEKHADVTAAEEPVAAPDPSAQPQLPRLAPERVDAETLRRTMEDLKHEVKRVIRDEVSGSDTAEQLRRRVHELQSQLAIEARKFKELEERASASASASAKVGDEIATLRTSLHHQQHVLREREQEVKELRRQLREQELTLERHEQLVLENKAFKARLADLQRERQRLQDDASKHLAAAATAKQQLAEKSVELEGLLDRIARLERERTTLHGEVTSLQASNNSLRSEMLAQSKEASDLKLRHELDRQRVLLLEHERALLQQQVAQSGRQLQQQPPLPQQPTAIHPTAVDSATQLVLEEHKALQERLQAALRTAETLRDEKLAEIEALREQHARDSADLQKRIAEYKAQLHVAVEQKRALEASARSLAEEKELALEQRKQQMQAAAQLQTQITLLRGEVTALKRVVLDHESQARLQAQKYEAVEREKEALRRALAQHDTDRRLAVEEREKALAMLNSALMHSSSAGGVGDNRQEQAAENEHAADMTHAPKEIPGVETHPAPRTPQGFAWCRACSLRQGSTCSIS